MRRWTISLFAAVLALAPAARAHAEEPERLTSEYVQPVEPQYVRAALEQVILLGLGFSQYAANHDLNSRDWDFAYSWSGLRDKLSPRGYSFDTNGFDTNFIRHPAAGTTYYWAARANRLSVLESLAVATLASTFWEYIGELRERASLNDILVTPVSGMVLGEMTFQLGSFFDRSCDSMLNRTLGTVLGPIKTLHDLMDGATPLRETQCDRLGLSQRGEHSFELSILSGALGTLAGPHVPSRIETRLELKTRIVALETYGAEGTGTRHFTDGNQTEFLLRGSFVSSDWTDFSLRATVVPFGLHYRAISRIDDGRRGSELLFGLLVGTEYVVHRFSQWQAATRLRDRYFELDVPGVSFEYRLLFGESVLSLELQTGVAFVAVDALALPEFRKLAQQPPLPTITHADGYNYAFGFRLQPRISWRYRGLQVGAELAAVRATAVTFGDRTEERLDYAHADERRTLATVWVRIGPEAWPLRFTFQAAWLQRAAVLAGARAERAELSLLAGLSAVF